MSKKKTIDKKDSKRVKITIKDIIKPDLWEGFKPIDPDVIDKIRADDEKRVEADEIRYEKEKKEEEERFNLIPCPSCKGIDKKRNIISHMNEPLVCGGRNYSTVHADYLICQGCGTMYADLNKKEIAQPYEGMYSRSRFGFW